jgi:hypothetical protein
MRIAPQVDAVVTRYYTDIVGPFWPPDRNHIENSYRTIPFPLDEITAPAFVMTAEWSLDALLGYLDTWSATRRYLAARGRHPLEIVQPQLTAAWGGAATRAVIWPLFLRAGRRRN